MNSAAAVKLIDLAVTSLMAVMNFTGASRIVSDTIVRRIAENREWTDEEREAVEAQLAADKRYARDALDAAPTEGGV